MKRVKPVSRYRGIGEVTHKAKPIARVRYDLCCRRIAETAQVGQEQAQQPTVQSMIDGNILVLKGRASLYTDDLYTLQLEGRNGRECDFYTQPIDVVTGVYQVRGHGDFRELPRRH